MKTKDIFIQPLTRIEGHLGIHAKADLDKKIYTDAHVYATMFRGFEQILKGREPVDAIWISQRVCGICPAAHALAAAICIDMAYRVPPPPLAVALRNLLVLAEQLYDAPLGCGILQGPDYSQAILSRFNPDVYEKAKQKDAPNAHLHGYKKISDIMDALNPVVGKIWQRCIEASKIGLKMLSIFGGKHPHIVTFVPGGIAKRLNVSDLEVYYSLLAQMVAFSKEFVLIFDDLLEFLKEKGFDKLGEREPKLLCFGTYDDIYSYNTKYQDMSQWGLKRKITPGVICNGKLLTTDLIKINVGICEFVKHSYYKETEKVEIEKDPAGNNLTKDHPFNEDTIPFPGKEKQWDGKYSWAKAVRWRDEDGNVDVYEVGALAMLWVTAKAKQTEVSTGNSIKFTLPSGKVVGYKMQKEIEFEWKIPNKPNIIERIRAKVYLHAYSAYIAYKMVKEVISLVNKGENKVWQDYKRPKSGLGVGMAEAISGALAHWCVIKKGKIYRYQVITPTAWNASPRDDRDFPGPYEEAIIDTVISEKGQELAGIDVVRIVRGF